MVVRPEPDHRADRPVRLRQVDRAALLQPDERPDPRRARRRARSPTTARTSTRPTSTRSRCGAGSAWSSRSRTRSRSRSTTTSPTARGSTAGRSQHGRPRRGGADPGRALGRGQGQAEEERVRAVRRPAAAAVHRALHRRRARRDPHGRAVLRRSTRSRPRRSRTSCTSWRSDYTIVIVTHNMQQAARVSRPHRVLHRRGRRARACGTAGWSRCDWTDEDLHQPGATAAPRTTSPAASADPQQ